MHNTSMNTTAAYEETGFKARRIDALEAEDLAALGGDKWTRYPGCIGAFIAEMDYGVASCIQEAMIESTRQGALGYISDPWKRRVADACSAWQRDQYGWEIDSEAVKVVPDVVEAYEIFLRDFVKSGNSVIVPTPAYMPFLSVPQLYDVECIEIDMLHQESSWLFDFDAIEKAFQNGCRAFVLCNPHNPIGKVLTQDELLHISALARKYGVRIFSDEIHASFVFDGHTHIPFASINETTAKQAVTATSVSKSFNIPGTKCAQVILTNADDLELWNRREMWSEHQTATIGAVATVAAYEHGMAWFSEAMNYVRRNIALVDGEMSGRFSKVGYIHPEGTYIAWLDFNPLGIDDPARYFVEKAGIALTDGSECGKVGHGCVRMNTAMPYPLLQESFDRMYCALHGDGLA
ncbi:MULTISPECIES: MalY/PatB family protein [Bifidobacterium]|uniref:MalY/PatB family protein n=1 Tax=Bifidobacterium TaxID=1678 RepID=UPI0039E925F2